MQDLRLRTFRLSHLCFSLALYTLLLLPASAQSTKIVIDAGHGGKDVGTQGRQIIEKDITLQLALELGKVFSESSESIDVLYTRQDDDFIPLHQRVSFANKSKADLFLSIHCNAVDTHHPSGIESYVLGLPESEENLEISKRENASILHEVDVDHHYNGFDPYSPEGHVFLSTVQNVYLEESIDLAYHIQTAFDDSRILKNRGVKQGGFVVLRKATMPAILIEVGFLTNESDENKLISPSTRSRIVQSIAKGILNHMEKANVNKNVITELSIHSEHKDVETLSPSISSQNTIKSDVAKEEYKILVASSINGPLDIDNSSFHEIQNLEERYDQGTYEYLVGSYLGLKEALLAQTQLRESGFKGAYVIKEQVAESVTNNTDLGTPFK